MADNDSDFGAFFAGFVIGGLVGAAAALVLAPQSGEETRAQIRQRGIELREQVVDTTEEARKRLDDAAAQARVQAEKLAQDARLRAEELQHRGKVVLEEQKGRLTAALDATRKPAAKAEPSRFEDALKRLEEIVTRLERGELALEDSLALYEEGIKLSRFCHTKLEEAEAKIGLLMKDAKGALVSDDAGQPRATPFRAENGGGEDVPF